MKPLSPNQLREAAKIESHRINHERELEKEKQLQEAAVVANSGSFGMTSRSKRRQEASQKSAVRQKFVEQGRTILVAKILQETGLFESPILDEEKLVEHIEYLGKEGCLKGLLETTLFDSPALTAGLDCGSPTGVAVYLGKVRSTDPSVIARSVIQVNAAINANAHVHKDATVSTAVNTLDTTTMLGKDAVDVTQKSPGLSEYMDKVMNSVTKPIAEEVKTRLVTALKEDTQKVSKDDMYAGLSEGAIRAREQRARRGTAPKYSLLQEMYATVRVSNPLSEGSVDLNTTDNYLTEATFNYALLETYRILGCSKASDEDVILALRKVRRDAR